MPKFLRLELQGGVGEASQERFQYSSVRSHLSREGVEVGASSRDKGETLK